MGYCAAFRQQFLDDHDSFTSAERRKLKERDVSPRFFVAIVLSGLELTIGLTQAWNEDRRQTAILRFLNDPAAFAAKLVSSVPSLAVGVIY
jgi:hypothetical protein